MRDKRSNTRVQVFLLIPAATLLLSAHPKIARDLDKVPSGSTVDVIVQFKQTPAERHHQKIRDKGGWRKHDLSLIKAGHYAVPAAALADLANDPDVEFISPDREVRSTLDHVTATVGSDTAQIYGYDGKGVGVAILDSGVAGSSDLDHNVAYKESFSTSKDPTDTYGHGTHVSGIVAGIAKNSKGQYHGVAPGVDIINLKVLGDSGTGTDSSVIAGIQRAIQLKSKYNIRVINLSLGRPVTGSYKTDPLCQAVEQAWNAGIVVVVAAGNEGRNNSQGTQGYGTITAPGNDPFVITVGAMNMKGTSIRSDDVMTSYSSKGPTAIDHILKPDLVAPGNQIVSVSPKGNSGLDKAFPGNIVNANYYRMSGTSMAAPVVSAAVALMLQKDPTLTPDQVKARLMRTASKSFPYSSIAIDPTNGVSYTSYYDAFTVGAGYLDVMAALNDTQLAMTQAQSPAVVFDAVHHTVAIVQGTGLVWGTGMVWGTSMVWGAASVSGTGMVWGAGLVWGTGASPQATSLVWGTGLIWGCGQPEGEATNIAIYGEN